MELTTVWFIAVAVLWIGYFVLEGFDFGVGMLMPLLGRPTVESPSGDRERRAVINTIGPHWDGNEVWLIVAVGATFAAFPNWYATLLSGFYLPVLAVLVALILRAVALEYRGKRRELAWRRRWDVCIVAGSAVPALVWGMVFGAMVSGVPIDATGEVVGGAAVLLTPFAVLLGLVTVFLFATHGAVFVALKTDGVIRRRARGAAHRIAMVAVVLTTTALGWRAAELATPTGWTVAAVSVVALLGAVLANARGREGWAFFGTSVATVGLFVLVFLGLFPALMPSSLDPAWSLTTANASATPYTLRILTVVAAVCLPVVLGYQGWTYWVFRRRITVQQIADDVLVPEPTPR